VLRGIDKTYRGGNAVMNKTHPLGFGRLGCVPRRHQTEEGISTKEPTGKTRYAAPNNE